MKPILFLLFAAILSAQPVSNTATGSITAASANCTATACVYILAPQDAGTYSVQLSGTFVATLQFESSVDGVAWVATPGTSSASATGAWNFSLGAQRYFRVRASAFTSGPVVVVISTAKGTALPGVTSDGANGLNVTGNLVVGTTVLTDAQQIDVKCSGDVTTVFQAAINTLMAASGGTVRLSAGSCVVTALATLPNDGATPPTQKSLRITGQGQSANGYWSALPTGGTMLDLQENDAVAKIDTRGAGVLEIDHITLRDSGSDCAAFVQTTNTTLFIHDAAFSGTATHASACNDAIILGGTSNTTNGTSNAPFQGYGTVIQNNLFDRTRRAVYGRTYANAFVFRDNTISLSSGSNLAGSTISAATNASPAVLTRTGHGIAIGATAPLTISGFTGGWATANGIFTATALTANTFSIPVNSTAFGALAGSPVFLDGAAIEILGDACSGGAQSNAGNNISGNLIESGYYPYPMKFACAAQHYIAGNGFYDPLPAVIAFLRFESTASNNTVIHGWLDNRRPAISDASVGQTVINAGLVAPSVLPLLSVGNGQPQIGTGANPFGPTWTDAAGNSILMAMGAGNNIRWDYTPNGGAQGTLANIKYGGAGVTQLILGGSSANFLDSGGAINVPLKLRGSEIWLQAPQYTSIFGNAPQFNTQTTGAATTNLGTNSPAVTATPNTWLTIKLADGSTAYVPAWK